MRPNEAALKKPAFSLKLYHFFVRLFSSNRFESLKDLYIMTTYPNHFPLSILIQNYKVFTLDEHIFTLNL